MPNHDDANFHGKALRVNLDDFSTTHVVDFQPSPKDAQGWPVACPMPNGTRTQEGRCGLVGPVLGSKDLFGYAYYVPHGLLARMKMDSFDAVEYVDVAAQDQELRGLRVLDTTWMTAIDMAEHLLPYTAALQLGALQYAYPGWETMGLGLLAFF